MLSGSKLDTEIITQEARTKVYPSKSQIHWATETYHSDESCAIRASRRTRRRHGYGYGGYGYGGYGSAPLSTWVETRALSHANLCGACGLIGQLLRVTSVRNIDLSMLLDTDKMADGCIARLDDMKHLRSHVNELHARAGLHAWAIPGLEDRIAQVDEAIARFDAVAYGELDEWSRRWTIGREYTSAPVPASVLIGPLGGIREVEAEFVRWSRTDQFATTRRPRYEALYQAWDAKAAQLEDTGSALLVCRTDRVLSFSAYQLGTTALRWLGSGESARLVPRRAAEMLSEQLATARLQLAWAPCDDDLGCDIARDLLAQGLPVEQVAAIAAATVQ